MKKITIYEFLKRNKDILYSGHAYWDRYNGWQYCPSYQYEKPKPEKGKGTWYCNYYGYHLSCFNIEDWSGDWEDSLIKVEHKGETK